MHGHMNLKFTHFAFKIFFFGNHAFYEIIWENLVQTDRQATDDCTTAHGLFVWMTKATNTHSEYQSI